MSDDGQPRELDDATSMRALAHPVRVALLDALTAEGELTASRAAALLGESPGNMSWHLQTLAKYGFVEESGTGKGRSRPWRRVHRTLRFDSGAADPEVRAAGEALEDALLTRAFSQFQAWRERRRTLPEWIEPSSLSNSVKYLTPEELGELDREIQALQDRYDVRHDPARRPPGARPVKLFRFAHPLVGDEPADQLP